MASARSGSGARCAAGEFLEEFPVNYPSIYGPDASEAASIGGGRSWPTTVFHSAKGERTYVRPGGYASLEQLRDDVGAHALAKSR